MRRDLPRLTLPALFGSWTLTLVGLGACSRHAPRGPDEAPVDRSDGALPTVRAKRVADGSIRVDGRLDEPSWRVAGATGGFVNPGHGRPEPDSSVPAAAWVAWDSQNLYLAFKVYDRHPESPFAPTEVDPHLWERASAVELMLQPGDPQDNRDYFEVQVGVNGARWTTFFDDYNRPITEDPARGRRFGHEDWEPAITSAARVEREGGWYTLEMALPFRDLTRVRARVPPSPGDTWRMNLYSFRDGQRASLAWSPLLGQGNFHRSARFGRLTFSP